MKHSPLYLVAKYVPDIQRMEPVNVGVLVWVNGMALSKFLKPELAAGVVHDLPIYQRWVSHWDNLISKDKVKFGRRAEIAKSSPGFFTELLQSQKGN